MPEQLQQNGEYFRRRAGMTWLWAGLLAGPVAIALNHQVAYLLVTLNCSYGKNTMVSPVVLAAILLAACGAFISWWNWRRAGSQWSDGGDDAVSRSRFMAILGMLFGGFSLLVIVAMWIPVFFYRSCQR